MLCLKLVLKIPIDLLKINLKKCNWTYMKTNKHRLIYHNINSFDNQEVHISMLYE